MGDKKQGKGRAATQFGRSNDARHPVCSSIAFFTLEPLAENPTSRMIRDSLALSRLAEGLGLEAPPTLLATAGLERRVRKLRRFHCFRLIPGSGSPAKMTGGPFPIHALCLIKDIPPQSRGAMRPSLDRVHPRKWEGAGNAGCALHPRSRAQWRSRCAHEHTGSAEAPGIPCVMALRLMPCSPRRRIRLVTVVGGFCGSSTPVGFELATADLAPATGVRTTRFCRTLKRRSSCAPAIAHEVQPALRPLFAPTLSRPPHPVPRS